MGTFLQSHLAVGCLRHLCREGERTPDSIAKGNR